MDHLEPQVAAELANDIYLVQDEALVSVLLARPEFTHNKPGQRQLTAKVGGRYFRATKDAFGLCAMGGTQHARELFVIFRGSTRANNNADWVSNFRIGVTPSKTGLPVHLGFNSIFTSMLPDIQTFISKHADEFDIVHCIGHSLGGAVATLMADWVKSAYRGKQVQLYTFGAPKPGLMLFTANFTRKIGKKNIYRVYHATDPVPMIPVFPFLHAPFPGFGHYIDSGESIVSAAAHDREKYITSVSNKTWEELERRSPPYSVDSAIEEFLRSNIRVSAHSRHIYHWLNAALIYVIKAILGAGARSIQYIGMVALSIADTIAYIFSKAIDLYQSVSHWVLLLMRKIMQVLGRKVPEKKQELTKSMMRDALMSLMEKTTDEARKAVRNIK